MTTKIAVAVVAALLPIGLAAQSPPSLSPPKQPASTPAVPDTVASDSAARAKREATFNVYGFLMTDAGYNADQIHPDWFDVVRPTKLPSFPDQYAPDGNTFYSVRQTRFGVKATVPTDVGDLFTQFEWELFGTGVDAGQTTLRLRHAYGELGHFGAGQTWSPFMDIDVFPNSIEYWGPSGMAFFRNVQVRWMPIQGDTRLTFALERPGASGDQGRYADRIELDDIRPHFPLPDFSAEYRYGGQRWGYVEFATILRRIEWEDELDDQFDLDGSATGWGLSLSSNLKFGQKDVTRLQFVYGEGIQNYMNDAPADIGPEVQLGNPVTPLDGVALPVFGFSGFLDYNWNDEFSSTAGYSYIDIGNSDGQAANAFNQGHYALGNLLWNMAPGVLAGVELQYGKRTNFDDDFDPDIFRVQFSFKYNFSRTFGGPQQ